MSGLFGNDEDNAVEKLKRAGGRADKTIVTAPERHVDDATAQVRLAVLHPPRRRYDPRSPKQSIDNRFPISVERPAYELDEDLKSELERLKGRGEGDEEALRRLGIEQLKREFRRPGLRRLLFDPRPLHDR
jgi:hypothetical protein